MSKRQAFRASNRFGLGPRPKELRQIGADPRGRLHHPLAPGPRSQPWLSNVAPSHEFDAQNVLELGLASPGESRQGWLNRALPLLAAENASRAEDYAMAIGQSVPLVLRGPEKVGSWAPARLPGPDDDLMERLVALYDGDAFLGPRLEAALNADRLAGGSPGGRGRPGEQFGKLAQAAARMLADTAGPRIAVLEAGGWDSHANQGREGGALARRLRRLDEGLSSESRKS